MPRLSLAPRVRGVRAAILRSVIGARPLRSASAAAKRGWPTGAGGTGVGSTGAERAQSEGADSERAESEGVETQVSGSDRTDGGLTEGARARSEGVRSGRHALGRWVRLSVDFEEAKDCAMRAFGAAGFSPLTTIDVARTLAARLGVEMERFEVLGMCNAGFARRALEIDRMVGLLLPCNVVVREDRMQPGVTLVEVLDPSVLFEVIDSDVVSELALQLTSAVTTAMAHLAETADAPSAAPAPSTGGPR